MVSIDKNATSLGVVVAGALLVLLFAGQVWNFAARWVARSISGAVLILIALGLGYAVTQLYGGWSSAKDEEQTFDGSHLLDEDDSSGPADVDDIQSEYVEGSLSEQEFEEELDSLLNEESSEDSNIEHELN